eukprot:scaffold22640_cov138-Cylindrotheca_fusiformis.AAC.2
MSSKDGQHPSLMLLEAIVANNISQVRLLLVEKQQEGIDPNATVGIAPLHDFHGDPKKSTNRISGIDKAFLWKKVFGDNPTLIHLSILSVFHRKRRRELTKAMNILDLLMEHGGNAYQPTRNIFLRQTPEAVQSSPLDFAIGVQQLALYSHQEHTALAMTQAITVMRKERQTKREIQNNPFPFEMIPLQFVTAASSYIKKKVLISFIYRCRILDLRKA